MNLIFKVIKFHRCSSTGLSFRKIIVTDGWEINWRAARMEMERPNIIPVLFSFLSIFNKKKGYHYDGWQAYVRIVPVERLWRKVIYSFSNSIYLFNTYLMPTICLARRRQWHPTPVLLPGKSHGQRSLVGCSPWGRWVRNDWATSLSLFTFMHWRRKWQPTLVFLPGESQGWGSLVGSHLWGRTESDTTEATQQQQQHVSGIFLGIRIKSYWPQGVCGLDWRRQRINK